MTAPAIGASGRQTPNLQDMTHGQITRMIWIDARLVGDGRLNRSDLMEAFSISQTQAVLDIKAYNTSINPGRLSYDRTAKFYRPVRGTKPAFTTPVRLNVFHSVKIVRALMEVQHG